MAVTDHDTVAGLREAEAEARALGIKFIPGVELSAWDGQEELHLLGYFVDAQATWFRTLLGALRTSRVERIREMIRRLHLLGVRISEEAVLRPGEEAVGRAHLARALVAAGYVQTPAEAFERYLGRGRPAWVPRTTLSPESAIAAIRRAGGVPVLAHPGRSVRPEHVAALREAGLEGIEAYYPEHTPYQTQQLLTLARRLDLVVTGGSDYHGDGVSTGAALGAVYVPEEAVAALEARRR